VDVGGFAPDHGESAFGLSAMHPGSTPGDTLDAYRVVRTDTWPRRSPSVGARALPRVGGPGVLYPGVDWDP
jgi:hypothetical protein